MNAESSMSVLVVEDEPFIAMALEAVLDAAGYRVRVAHDGVQALEAVAAETPDLVTTDLMLPNLDGRELLRRLNTDHPALPVLVLTGNPPNGGVQALQGEQRCPMALLTKPVNPAQLLQSLTTLLSDRRHALAA